MSFRKYSPLTTNCKCAMEHQIFYQEESENFPNFHQSAAGTWLNQWFSVWMGWTTATCHHVKLLLLQPGWLGNLWSILVPAAGESWTTIQLEMKFRVTWTHDAIMNNNNLHFSVWTGNKCFKLAGNVKHNFQILERKNPVYRMTVTNWHHPTRCLLCWIILCILPNTGLDSYLNNPTGPES